MKSKILSSLLMVFLASTAFADSKQEMIGLHMNPYLSDYIFNKVIRVNSSGNTVVPVASGKIFQVTVAKTPVAQFDQYGSVTTGVVPYVATPATNLTPVAGSNDVRGYTIVATAAPTNAALALSSSPTNGDSVFFYNSGANPVVVAALGTPVVNNAANRRIAIAAKGALRCRYSSSLLSWICELYTALATPAA